MLRVVFRVSLCNEDNGCAVDYSWVYIVSMKNVCVCVCVCVCVAVGVHMGEGGGSRAPSL